MSRRRKGKRPPQHELFEAINPHGVFVKIVIDFTESAAWQALTLAQRGLYLMFKLKYRQRVEGGVLVWSNVADISLPESEWGKLYGDYRTFRRDYERLIQLGFIKLIQRGNTTQTPNIYGFSDDWKKFTASTIPEPPAKYERKKRLCAKEYADAE
mgnify:CR=1 FL=1